MPRDLLGDIDAFLDYCLDQNRSRKTVSTYRQVLLDFSAWLTRAHPEIRSISDIERSQIQGYARWLRVRTDSQTRAAKAGEGDLSVRTRAKYLAAIRSFLKYFAVETDIQVLARDRVTLPRSGDHLPAAVVRPSDADVRWIRA